MMSKIRVFVVDDAIVFRRVVSDELAKDPALEVVGTAANGRIALTRIPQVNPDLVILDIEMPELDGLQTLAELRKTHPKLPVIMFSALTERGAMATLDALALGATGYFPKPTSEGGLDAAVEVLRTKLIPEIKAICNRAKTTSALPASSPRTMRMSRVEVLAIGASTGGPNALTEIFQTLPADLPVPIVIVQHMPAMFTRLLAERLTAQSSLQVHEGQTGELLKPGHAFVAPGGHHMIVVKDGLNVRVRLNQDAPENSCRPAVDPLFRSVAQVFGGAALGVMLTGMGQDGLRGCEVMHQAGASIFAQDEATSVVWGMPGAVVRAGLAERVLPLSALAATILERVQMGRKARAS
jgi:two-component system, chemotaxis family, protein-glutamate methylesterase/glutaminase